MLSRGFRFFGLTALALGSALLVNGCRTKAPTNAYNGLLSSRDLIPPPYANLPAGGAKVVNPQVAENDADDNETTDDFGSAPMFIVPAGEATEASAPDKDSVLVNAQSAPAGQAAQPAAAVPAARSTSPLAAVPPVSGRPAKGGKAPAASSKATPSDKTYTVVAGDTLGSIAQRYGVSWKDLQAVNNGIKPERLKIGQKLILPSGSKNVPAASGAKGGKASAKAGGAADGVYTVVAGDSLWVIARRFKVTSDDLRAWNNLTSDSLKVGQKLKVRGDATVSAPTKTVAPKKEEPKPAEAEAPKADIPANLLEDKPVQNPVVNTEEPPADILKQEAALKAEAEAAEAVVNTPPAAPVQQPIVKVLDHTVQPGSTLEGIASSYNISVADILKQNPQIKTDADLVQGSVIKIPYTD